MNKTEPNEVKPANTERNAEEEFEEAFNILQLPDDITQEIFLRIPFKTLIQCKFVCKSWHSFFFSNPDFTKTLVSLAPTGHFLLDQDTNKHVLAFVRRACSRNNMVLKRTNPNALYNRVNGSGIIGSSNGFLCLFRRNQKIGSLHFSVSNPITGKSIPLPIIKGDGFRDNDPFDSGFGFGFSSVSHVYKVVRFTKRNPQCNKAEIMVLTVGSEIWRSIGKVSSIAGQLQTTNGVFHDGFIHWIWKCKRSPSRYIRAFDVESERLKNLPMPPCETTAKIGVLNGSLSITSFSSDTLQVWLRKEYQGKKDWTRKLDVHDSCLMGKKDIEVLNLIKIKRAPLQVLLLVDSILSLYTPSTSSLVEVQIDGIPYRAMNICVHIPSFVSPKDIIRDYNSKHPEEVAETSDIKLQAENNDTEVVEIRRGQPTTCLPLPKNLKHVSAATASTLLEMIGLNALLLNKCRATRDEIKRLRKENEEFHATAKLVSGRPDDDASPS